MAIEIIELEKGFAVKFPFELKDNFKEVFPSSKWNRYERQWEVGPRSGKRLEQWVAAAQVAAEEIETAQAAELNQQELIKLQAEIEKIRVEVARTRKASLAINAVELLERAKEEVKIAKAELEKEKRILLEETARAEEIMKGVCDLDGIYDAMRVIEVNHSQVGAGPRNKFRDAQAFLEQEQERLRKIGYISAGIYDYCALNFNRPDRDRASDARSVFELWEYKEEEE